MKTEIKDVSPTRKEIRIEIEPEAVRRSYDRVSDRYAKLANVPGFRRGHAPRDVVRTRFKSEIRSEVLRELVPDAINEAIDQHELITVGEPHVHFDDSEKFERLGDQPISLQVELEVLPKVTLGQYKGIKASRSVRPITDADVERMIEGLRNSSASLQPVEDREAALGDTVTIDVIGKFLDGGEDDIDLKEVDVVLGGERVAPEFTDNLVGVRVDDERSFIVNYPEDFSTKSLAGRKLDYKAKVIGVRVKELPELDDEWARSLGEFDSLQALREGVRRDLEQNANWEADRSLRGRVLESLVAEHDFAVPETLINHQVKNRLQDMLSDMMGRGIDPRNQAFDWEGAREQLRDLAEGDVRSSMMLELVAEKEQLEVTEEEIEDEVKQIAVAMRQPLEQVNATLTKEGGKRSIANRLRNRKALDLLVQNAQITEEQWNEEAAAKAEEPNVASAEREGDESAKTSSSSP
jgi:trigger factor